MDIATIAIAALSSYLSKGAEAFFQSVGEDAAEKVGNLYESIKAKFKGDSYAEQTLARMEENPSDEGRQSAMQSVLFDKIKSDPKFASNLSQLLENIKKTDKGSVMVIASGDRAVSSGKIQNSTVITGDIEKN